MKLIKPSIELINPQLNEAFYVDFGNDIKEMLEKIGRVCYKSEDKIDEDTSNKFINMLVSRQHFSVIEHISLTFNVICDRGVSHEIVRHRLASYSQESTRYCNYSKDKFDNQLTFILPCWFEQYNIGNYSLINAYDILCLDDEYEILYQEDENDFIDEFYWVKHMLLSEKIYLNLIKEGWQPQQARSILPNSLKTEIMITMNLREWLHFCKLRCSEKAHPQMREVALKIREVLIKMLPEIFDYEKK